MWEGRGLWPPMGDIISVLSRLSFYSVYWIVVELFLHAIIFWVRGLGCLGTPFIPGSKRGDLRPCLAHGIVLYHLLTDIMWQGETLTQHLGLFSVPGQRRRKVIWSCPRAAIKYMQRRQPPDPTPGAGLAHLERRGKILRTGIPPNELSPRNNHVTKIPSFKITRRNHGSCSSCSGHSIAPPHGTLKSRG